MDQFVEIDCLDCVSISKNADSHDATCIRYGAPDNFCVMVFDCGKRQSVPALVKHIREHYTSNTVDHLVCSCLDIDNLLGMALILEQMEVLKLWLHRPWAHSKLIEGYVASGKFDARLGAGQKNTARAAYALERSAVARGIPVIEPFQGASIGAFSVLSPQRQWYAETLAKDRSPLRLLIKLLRDCLGPMTRGLSAGPLPISAETHRVGASAANVALFGRIGMHTILLTSDAGQRVMSCSSVPIGIIPRRVEAGV